MDEIQDFLNDKIISKSTIPNGCIDATFKLETESKKTYFLKTTPSRTDAFEIEAKSLRILTVPKGPRIPKVVGVGSTNQNSWLILEWIESSTKGSAHEFGKDLATLHLENRSSYCGLDFDNRIGSTKQLNKKQLNWFDFFSEFRLSFQINLAVKKGLITSDWIKKIEKINLKLENLLIDVDNKEASLLHGDLWSGNVMYDQKGKAVLFDPAIYYGHREADLAMLELFGNPSKEFFIGYNEVFPIASGYENRRDIYNLYHILNHLNLFGKNYIQPAKEIIERYQ